MFAVVQIGSAQFKVSEGDVIDAHRIQEEEGKSITLDKVLMFADGTNVRIGRPFLSDVKITATVVRHHLDAKKIAFKYRRRENYARTVGHRQKITALTITKISG